tara:strand:- start:1743 stop:2618 length:876 start_codon:yes stop_codon:yes gene_type:complete
MRIVVLGGEGLLGKRLIKNFRKKSYFIQSISRQNTADFIVKSYSFYEIDKAIKLSKASLIINTVALTNVDVCEINKTLAYEINAKICDILSQLQLIHNFKIIHISTDQVYSGEGPHKEENTNPINNYGNTKLLGENFLNKKNSLIIRTNFFGKSISKKPSYTDWLIENYMKNPNKKIKISKSYFSPLNLETLIDLIEKSFFKYKLYGIYNLGSFGKINKLEFSKKFLNIKFNNSENIQSSFSNFDNIIHVNTSAAIRPNDMTLNCKKFINETYEELPNEEKLMKDLLLEYK